MTTLQENLESARLPLRFGRTRQRRPWRNTTPNISTAEQWASVLVGSGLVFTGLRRFSRAGLIVAGAGVLLIRRGLTKHSGLYDRLGIDTAEGAASPEAYFHRGIHLEQVCTVDRDPMDLYCFWRDVRNFSKFTNHVVRISRIDDHRSHWVVTAPAGRTVEWDAELINDEPGVLLAWRSLAGADVHNAGSVRFLPSPDKRGTDVHVVVDYIPPAGRLGAFVARLFGENPQQQIRDDLLRFKQVMEAGAVSDTQGQTREACRL